MVKRMLRRLPSALVLAMLGTVTLSVVVSMVVLSSRKPLAAVDAELPPDLRPGNRMLHNISFPWTCDYWNNIASCTDNDANGIRYYVSYTSAHPVITGASKWLSDSGIRIGDLILAWGQPISRENAIVSWGNRSAFAMGNSGFSPFDKVYFVSYTLTPTQEDPWRGFVNETSSPPLQVRLPTFRSLAPSQP